MSFCYTSFEKWNVVESCSAELPNILVFPGFELGHFVRNVKSIRIFGVYRIVVYLMVR